jgi:glycosyltransferase involved in cell wall biosynthesis
MGRVPVTVIAHVLNEIENIEACLASVSWADEIYVIDSFSNDGTVDLIRNKFPHVRLEQREYLGAASAKNYAIDRAAHDWIFVIDADERVTRLFHRGHARYPNKRVHADLVVDGETRALANKMDHYYIRDFDHMIAKMTRYAYWGAAQMFIDGKTTSAFGIFGHALGKFVRDYVFNFGFLDGARGVISVGMHVYYTFWKYAKLWEMTQLKRLGKPVPLPKLDEDEGRWELPWLAPSHRLDK